METRSNIYLMSIFVALVLAAVVAFSLWLSGSTRGSARQYDVVLDQSVSGLLVGSPVTFSGVPVGRIESVELDEAQPGRVRVRIAISKDELPIPEGTVARLNGDLLFGTALISLEPSKRSGPPLVAREGEEVPVIQVEQSGLANLASDPTPMIESISYATDRLLAATTPEEQRRLSASLDALVLATEAGAKQSGALGARIAPAREAIRANAATSAGWTKQAAAARRGIETRGPQQVRELREALAAAREATAALDTRLAASRPKIRAMGQAVAGVSGQVQNARAGVAAVTEAARTIETGGVGLLVSGPPTPNYEPKDR